MGIRYDKKINKEIERTINNYNAKIRRLERQGLTTLPDRITKKELKQEVTNRRELKGRLKELKMFSQRGIEEEVITKGGVKISKYEERILRRRVTNLKRRLTNEINRLSQTKPTVFGIEQPATLAQMGSDKLRNLEARRKALDKNLREITREEYSRYIKLVGKGMKSYAYQDNVFMTNYLDILKQIGEFYDIPQNQVNKISKKISLLEPKEFYELYNTEKSITAIMDYSTSPLALLNKIGVDLTAMESDVRNLYLNLSERIDEIVNKRIVK